MALQTGWILLAEVLQEAAASLSAKELRDSISKGVDVAHKDGTKSANYVDHMGDHKSGDVIYQVGWSGDDYRKAPYTKDGNRHSVNADKAVKVRPRMNWEPGEPDADDAAEAAKKTKEAEAKKAAEAATKAGSGDVSLVESAAFPTTFAFKEAATALSPLVKVISPGRGSSGYYSADVLKKAAESKIFARGTLMYFNHATPAEEAQRPEGDYNRLAAVTTGDAYWDEAGKDGPALYAPAKVFAKHAQEVAEKAPHTGVSIRASGKRDDKAMGPDGKPGVIVELTRAESIDLVTKAGRDGKLLLESADSSITEGDAMSADALQKLQEVNRGIAKRLAVTEARTVADATLKDLRLPATAKESILARALGNVPITEALEFDQEAFKKVMEAEIAYAASFLPGGVKAVGVGATAPDPKVVEATREANKKAREVTMRRSARAMGIRTDEGMRIFLEGRGAFDPNYNSADERLAVGTEA